MRHIVFIALLASMSLVFGINPKQHGFKAYYYGVGTLRK